MLSRCSVNHVVINYIRYGDFKVVPDIQMSCGDVLNPSYPEDEVSSRESCAESKFYEFCHKLVLNMDLIEWKFLMI